MQVSRSKKRRFSIRVKRKILRTLYPSLLSAVLYRLCHPRKKKFLCPLCAYQGPFRDGLAVNGVRVAHSLCPRCGSNVRMRLQFLVMKQLASQMNLSSLTIHHFSPEAASGKFYKEMFGNYLTAGLTGEPVDCPADLTALPFSDHSCDFIFASHILEHILDDEKGFQRLREC